MTYKARLRLILPLKLSLILDQEYWPRLYPLESSKLKIYSSHFLSLISIQVSDLMPSLSPIPLASWYFSSHLYNVNPRENWYLSSKSIIWHKFIYRLTGGDTYAPLLMIKVFHIHDLNVFHLNTNVPRALVDRDWCTWPWDWSLTWHFLTWKYVTWPKLRTTWWLGLG